MAAATGVGCSKSFETLPGPLGGNSAASVDVGALGSLSCLATSPQYSIDTSIDSFALTSGASANAGFGIGGILQAIGIDVSYSTGELDMSMNLFSPLYKNTAISNATGGDSSQNFSFSLSAVVNLINGGIGAWHTTGLYDLSNGALSNTYTNLIANAPAMTWSTVVSQDLGNQQFLLPVGTTAGLLAGDTFNVYKVQYIWGVDGTGTPCNSVLQMVKKNTLIGTATVGQIDNFASYVDIKNPTLPVSIGDRLEIKKLAPAANGGTARTNLRYSVHLGSLTQSKGLMFQTGLNSGMVSVDMTPFVKAQLQDLLVNQLGTYYLQ
jgi:hypothetical protein